MSFYTTDELLEIGFAKIGSDVKISRNASIYNPSGISLGSHVRIDDFCVLSAGFSGIEIGNYVHIAVFCSLMGQGKITLKDFSGLSSRVSIYSSNDDYSGEWLTNPTVPAAYTNVTHADVTLERHAVIGAGTVILPGVIIEEGAAVGSLSLVNKSCNAFTIYQGAPARRIKDRHQNLLLLEKQLLAIV
ncbi:MAG: hypothetical protein WCP20_09945 [Desulfuromonadales bacterium]